MTDDIDIADFIDARITEDEEAAHTAGGTNEHWHADGGSVTRGHPTDQVVDYTTAADHIARHDPPRVLRECAARRRTLERHQPIDTDSTGSGPCLRCAHCIRAGITTWPCPDAADLASTWADHGDYKKEWTP